jgi:hypothetical protein
VETMAIPNPLRILGMVEELEYLRKTWFTLDISYYDSLVSLSYFKAILIEP